jgi:Competence protein J (ComJ)
MKTSILGRFGFKFDYNQFLVYDASVDAPECTWTREHCNQGFARRGSVACMGTILQYGQAEATAFYGPYLAQDGHERVIALPFYSPTGRIVVRGMMEIYLAHILFCGGGHYKLYVAQWIADEEDEREGVDLFFHRQEKPVTKSEIIVADEGLSPPATLLESSAELSD